MISRRIALYSLVGALTLPALGAWAGDDGLYEGVFDPDSSFVRVVAPGQSFASIDDTTIRDLDGGVSAYVNVMPGQIEVTMPDGSTTVDVQPASHYTVVMAQGSQPVVLQDEITQSPSRADISVYNLSSRNDVELFVPAAKAVAIEGVGPEGGKSVAIKAPLTLDLEMRADEEVLASVAQVALERKAGMSLVLTEADGGFTATAVPNSYSQ